MTVPDELYFDAAATTPLAAEVKQRLVDMMGEYGNPSSLHKKGLSAERILEDARQQVLKSLGVTNGKLVFTGSGTEADNLAVFGIARRYRSRGRHLVTTQIEHPAVLESFKALEAQGFDVTYVAPTPSGVVRSEDVIRALREDTILVSVMHVNNETGALLPVEEIGEHLKQRRKTLFHVDGIQAFGRIRHSARQAGADLYTVSAHKIGGPKGVGALYIRQGIEVSPVIYGGGQEYGLRSGTQNVLFIDAFAMAARTADHQILEHHDQVAALCAQLCAGLSQVEGCVVNRPDAAVPNIVSVSFPGLRGEVVVHALESENLYVSTGSACSSKSSSQKGSHVLRAMGMPVAQMTGTVRFSFLPSHSAADVELVIEITKRQVNWLRSHL